jgi:hypothetical protein
MKEFRIPHTHAPCRGQRPEHLESWMSHSEARLISRKDRKSRCTLGCHPCYDHRLRQFPGQNGASPVRLEEVRLAERAAFAWLGRNRRLSKDYKYRVQTSELMIDIAATRLMLNRVAR